MLLVNGTPAFLFNAVTPAKGSTPKLSFTMAAPIATIIDRSNEAAEEGGGVDEGEDG